MPNWFDGSAAVAWTQGTSAIIGGAAGTVTLGVPITAQNLTFGTSGYTITGSRLTLGAGSTSTINLAPGTASVINSAVAGPDGLLVTGGGTLTLGGANTFTGAVNIAAGTVVPGNNSALGSTAAGTTIAAGATLDLNGKNISSEPVALDGGTVTNSSGSDGKLGSLVVNANSFLTPNSGWIAIRSTSGAGSLTIYSSGGRGVFDNSGGLWAHSGGTVLNSGGLDLYQGTTITGGPLTINGATFNTFGALGGRIGSNIAVTVNGGAWSLREAPETIGSLAGTGGTVRLNAFSLTAGGTDASTAYSGILTGTGGSFRKTGAGTLTLSGRNTYTGSTTISGGILSTPLLVNGATSSGIGSSGNAAGNLVLDGGALQYTGVAAGTDRLFTLTTNGGGLDASGSGALAFTNAGTIALNGGGARSFTLTGSNTDNNTLASVLGDSGGATSLVKSGTGSWALTGANTYSGGTNVNAGALFINGNQSAATGTVSVASGARLGGVGTIGGSVNVASGGTFGPGVGAGVPGTLTINGNLTLSSGSTITYQLGQAGVVGGALNDHTVVNGNLTLDGTLNVTASGGGSFDPGVYRLFGYGGALTNNGLVVGTVPTPDFFLQTSVPNQINLINTNGLALNFWDGGNPAQRNNGVIDGGNGAWQNSAGIGNWTDLNGALNSAWNDGAFAIFEGTAGTVTVDNSLGQVVASGLDFVTAGYTIDGAPLTLTETNAGTGRTIVRVEDTATIASVLQGTVQLVKTDPGTLILTGANTYSGGTAINGGTLQISSDANLGAPAGALSLDGGTLATTASFGSARVTTLNAGGGTLDVANGTTLTMTSAIGGAGALTKINTGTLVLTGANTYSGGTSTNTGTLQLGDGTTNGSISGNVSNNAVLAFNPANGTTMSFGGVVSGAGALNQTGAGTTILTGANTYSGGTSINAGTLQLGDGTTNGSIGGNVANNAVLAFNPANGTTMNHSGVISGTGAVNQTGPGTTILTGANTYSGGTSVNAGALFINGNQSAATGTVSVASGARLGGVGTIGGSVNVASGGTFGPGVGAGVPGTLTINGNLTLSSGSTITYQLGQAGVVGGALNDHTVVNGNLTLDGTLNVTASGGGSFDPGVYRLFGYGGALTNNGLVVGTVPTPDFFLQTSVPNQINLINTNGLALNFWDGGNPAQRNNGVIDGGNGAWQNSAGIGNWTDLNGALNSAWNDGAFAIFEGTAGTVTVDNSLGQVVASGLDFVTAGYTIDGAPLTLTETNAGTGRTIVRVEDTATIASVLQGTVQLVKTDPGTLILTGANTYSGGTAINGGTLQISSDANLGAPAGALSLDGGTLATTASFGSARVTTLNAGGGTLDVANGTTLTMTSAIGGAGALTKINTGTLVLTGANTYSGGTSINTGTLQLGDGTTNGSISGNVSNNAVLAFNPVNGTTMSFGGVVSGAGALNQTGAGTTILTGVNTYSGGTSITAGTLQVGDGTTNGSISGNVNNNAALAFNPANGTTMGFGGGVSGTGALKLIGTGTLILTGANSYSGGTAINGGTLQVASDVSLGAAAGALSLDGGTLATTASFSSARASTLNAGGGTFDVAQATTLTMSGAIGGAGALTQANAGTLILTGANTYTGGTSINAGTLQLGDGTSNGSISGNVNNNAALAFNPANGTMMSFGGVVSGTGAVEQTGSGTTVLTGANTYTGGTTISSGTVQLGNGAATGSITGNVAVDNGTLAFNRNNLYAFDGLISGSGGVSQAGTGTTVLSAANTYSGATTVAAGTLRAASVNAFSANSAHIVASGATLDTAGFSQRVAALDNGGTVSLLGAAPGSTLTVTGAY
ncbi:beta strand repeat-containing protein, partial [Variovorax rhizosphaerae]